ncbi:hypothetical protein [Microbacterium sp. NPDC056234]|uniref:hypothetical protein n=1 Tax=Microbacterium sp. NPDC056234 TaxID=3345757 RepID=UPI0035DC7ED9
MTATHEAWVTDGVLLVFDGTVLEIFGYSEAVRLHIAYRPELVFEDGRHLRLTIRYDNRRYHAMDYEPSRRHELEALAERVRAAHRPL